MKYRAFLSQVACCHSVLAPTCNYSICVWKPEPRTSLQSIRSYHHLLPPHAARGGAVLLYADSSLVCGYMRKPKLAEVSAGNVCSSEEQRLPSQCHSLQHLTGDAQTRSCSHLTTDNVDSPLPTFPSSGSFLKWIPCTSTCASPPAFTAQITRSARLGPPPSAQHCSASSDSTAATSPTRSCAVTRCIATHSPVLHTHTDRQTASVSAGLQHKLRYCTEETLPHLTLTTYG